MNNKGEIMVPTEQYDNLLLQLAAKGYAGLLQLMTYGPTATV